MKEIYKIVMVSAALFSSYAYADLPTRAEQLDESFAKDRAAGLIALNSRYLEIYRQALAESMKAGNLEEANAIKAEMESLEKEVASLSKLSTMTDSGDEAEPGALLVGKTVMFPHDTKPEDLVGFRFMENGEAVWIGLGGIEVERAYELTDEPRKFHVWWPARENLPGYEVTVSDDGKSAVVTNKNSRYTAEGKLERSRR